MAWTIFNKIWPVWADEKRSVENVAMVATQRKVGIHASKVLRRRKSAEEGLGNAEDDNSLTYSSL